MKNKDKTLVGKQMSRVFLEGSEYKGECYYEACKNIKHKEITEHSKKRWMR